MKYVCGPYHICRDTCGEFSTVSTRMILSVVVLLVWFFGTLWYFGLPANWDIDNIGIIEWLWFAGAGIAFLFACCGQLRSMVVALIAGVASCAMSCFMTGFAAVFSCAWNAVAGLGLTSLLVGGSTAGVEGMAIVEAGAATDAAVGSEAAIAADAAVSGEAAAEGTAVADLAAVSEAAYAAETAGEVAEVVSVCAVS